MSLEARLLREAAYSLSGTDPQETQALLQMAAAKIDELHTLLADRDARLAALEHWNKHYTTIECPQCGFAGGREHAAAGAAPAPCVVLTPEERAAFERFHETWEDNEGYDVPKEMMRRLAEVGVVHHITAGRYDITKFGHYVLAAGAAPVPQGRKITATRIANHLKKSPLGDISMYRNGFFDGAKWATSPKEPT